MKRLLGGCVAALAALVSAWSCGGLVSGATGGAGGSTSVGSHAASVSSTSGSGGGFGGATSGGFGGVTSGGGSAGAGGSGCPNGTVMCAGLCTDPLTDPSNCATCGTVCSFPNAGAACVAGECKMGACESGWADCNGHPGDGCEVDVGGNDPMNCGACGAACLVPHQTAVCTQGMCTLGPCDPGWTDCNLNPVDGCEANLQNDPMNCGQCGLPCEDQCPGQCVNNQCECQDGVCGGGCPKGTANCNSTNPHCQFCDTLLGTNSDCNYCGDVCALPNATSQCTPDTQPPFDSVCALVSCNAGFADCDMVASNGCEVATTTDPANCGACGNACASSQTCSGGTCQ